METLISLCLGLGLSAACGFRVFVPLLLMGLGVRAGMVHPAEGFEWVGSWLAIGTFAGACGLEIVGYYVPWVDHLLDTVATPAAAIAGALVAAAGIDHMSPLLHWGVAAVAGGGLASAVQVGTVTTRAASTATTAGFGNPIVATVENVAATVLSVVAIVVPVVVGLLVVAMAVVLVRGRMRKSRGRIALA